MEAVLLYLLKANAVLALFAAAYYGLLRRLTFFRLNRAFLLLALVFAAVYPALPMPGLLPAEAPVPTGPGPAWALAELPNAALADAPQPTASGLDWAATGLLVYAVGAGLLLARLLVQLVALGRLRRTARPATTPTGVSYRQLPTPGDPFSFGRTIYLHAEQYAAAELAVVLAHERAHISQHHTLDVLLAHLGTALFWVNPAAWLLRRALLDNLEYLADAATLRTGLDRRAYQYCLLRLSRGPVGPALALPFSFLTLKNRVAMMNTPLSSNGQLARYFLAGPLVVLAALGYSAAHAREAAPLAPRASVASPAGSTTALAAGHSDFASLPKPKRQPANTQPTTSPRITATNSVKVAHPQQPTIRITHSGYDPLCYLDGQEITMAQFKALDPTIIDAINILKGEAARQMAGDRGANGIVIITTQANKASSTVLEFTERVQRLAPPQQGPGSVAFSLPAGTLYYLDGKPSTQQLVEQLDPKSIAATDMVSDRARVRRIPGLSDSPATSVVLVTTKANADAPAVRAFADQAGLASAYTFRPVGVNVLVPVALAYITSHYPNARLNEVQEQKYKTTGALKYQVQLINGKRPFYVYFSQQGEFLGE